MYMQIRKFYLLGKGANSIHVYLFLLIMVLSCSNSKLPSNSVPKNNTRKEEVRVKPPSTFQDSLKVVGRSAVFYQADTFQLHKIKEVTAPQIYEGSMHEYFYQTKNAKLVLKKNWKQISILEAKNVRYLDFLKVDKSHEIIDLNKYNDAFGLFIFDGNKKPVLVDMTNTEEALYFYFSK